MALDDVLELVELLLTGRAGEILGAERLAGALLVLVQVVQFHPHSSQVAGADDVPHILVIGHPVPVGQQVHGLQDVLLHAARAEVCDRDGRVLHHVVEEPDLLLQLVLPGQSHRERVRDGGVAVEVLQPVVGLDGDAKDVFDAHTRQGLIHRQRYERSLTGFVNKKQLWARMFVLKK